jgi:serine/threonine protein kinase
MREVQTKFPRSKVIGERYIIDEPLGQGGFGTVYRVHDRRVKNNVFALKEIINPNRRVRENFTFEGELLRRLDHPHLPRVYRIFEDEKQHRLYMLMDYIDGPNLERLRVRQPERRFTFAQTLKIMAPIIEAVVYLHTQTPPIIHRDIKPANIIVPTSGDDAVLVDFSIAKEYDLNATTTAIRHCSPSYGAPEQYICDTSPRTDIYGLGATFYTLLTGRMPIDSLYRITSLSAKGADPLVPMHELTPELPIPVADTIQRALAIDSNERFASVDALWKALKECDSGRMTDSLSLDVGVESAQGMGSAADGASPCPACGLAPQVCIGSAADRAGPCPACGLAPQAFGTIPTAYRAVERGLATLPTVPSLRNPRQSRQTIDTRDGEYFLMELVSLMVMALGAEAFFVTMRDFWNKHNKK